MLANRGRNKWNLKEDFYSVFMMVMTEQETSSFRQIQTDLRVKATLGFQRENFRILLTL